MAAAANRPILVIGNKNYSSWSLRPWLALTMAGIPFEEKLVRFGEPRFSRKCEISGAGLVPVLVHRVRPSGSCPRLSSTPPAEKLRFGRETAAARAMARSAAAEIHSGFGGWRNDCPMNLRRPNRWRSKAGFSNAVLSM